MSARLTGVLIVVGAAEVFAECFRGGPLGVFAMQVGRQNLIFTSTKWTAVKTHHNQLGCFPPIFCLRKRIRSPRLSSNSSSWLSNEKLRGSPSELVVSTVGKAQVRNIENAEGGGAAAKLFESGFKEGHRIFEGSVQTMALNLEGIFKKDKALVETTLS